MTDLPPGWDTHERRHPPFEPGNDLATQHGAYSPAKVDPIAQQLVDALLSDPDVAYLRLPSYQAAIAGWARAESRVALLTKWLEGKDPVDGKMPVLEQLRAWEASAERARARLGLDPTSRAKLLKDLAVTSAVSGGLVSSLSGLAERGRESRIASEKRRALEAVPDGGGDDDDAA